MSSTFEVIVFQSGNTLLLNGVLTRVVSTRLGSFLIINMTSIVSLVFGVSESLGYWSKCSSSIHWLSVTYRGEWVTGVYAFIEVLG